MANVNTDTFTARMKKIEMIDDRMLTKKKKKLKVFGYKRIWEGIIYIISTIYFIFLDKPVHIPEKMIIYYLYNQSIDSFLLLS